MYYFNDNRRFSIVEKLTTAVIEQLGGRDENTDQTMRDIMNHGVDGGFSGFIYYSDTVEFYNQNKDLIIERLEELAEDLGSGSVMLLVKSFRCAQDLTDEEIGRTLYGSEPDQMAANCLAWFAAEEVAMAEANT